MTVSHYRFALLLALAAPVLSAQRFLVVPIVNGTLPIDAQVREAPSMRQGEQRLFDLTNQSRARQALPPLQWDPALASSALAHCLRMVADGELSHQSTGEPELERRAGQAGAHFSLIEENVAAGYSPVQIQESWMNSPRHRANLLNPDVDRVGIALVAGKDWIFAVVNFAKAVPVLSQSQIEATVANLMHTSGIEVRGTSPKTRLACALESGLPILPAPERAGFIMRWQGANLTQLPQALIDRIASNKYNEATVGSCATQGESGTFEAYRIAVVLLESNLHPSTTRKLATTK